MTDEIPALDDFWKDGIPEEFVWKTGLNNRLVLGSEGERPIGALQEIHCKLTDRSGTPTYDAVIYRMVTDGEFPRETISRIAFQKTGPEIIEIAELAHCRIVEVSPLYRCDCYHIADVVRITGAQLFVK